MAQPNDSQHTPPAKAVSPGPSADSRGQYPSPSDSLHSTPAKGGSFKKGSGDKYTPQMPKGKN